MSMVYIDIKSTLLHGTGTWPRPTIKKRVLNLNAKQMRTSDRSSGKTERELLLYGRGHHKNEAQLLAKGCLHWAGHASRTDNERLPKTVLFSQLEHGIRSNFPSPKLRIDMLEEHNITQH